MAKKKIGKFAAIALENITLRQSFSLLREYADKEIRRLTDQEKAIMHPLAIKNDSGANEMKSGDRIVYIIDGRHGVANEFLHDGDAFVTFDDGKHQTVKWNYLMPERSVAP